LYPGCVKTPGRGKSIGQISPWSAISAMTILSTVEFARSEKTILPAFELWEFLHSQINGRAVRQNERKPAVARCRYSLTSDHFERVFCPGSCAVPGGNNPSRTHASTIREGAARWCDWRAAACYPESPWRLY